MEPDVTIKVSEYNRLKSLEKDIEELKKGSKIIITRYDRDIEENNPILDTYTEYIYNDFIRMMGDFKISDYIQKFGTIVSPQSEIHFKTSIKLALQAFIIKHINTTNKKPFSKVRSELINFSDIEDEIKEIYNHKYFEEFGEKINEYNEKKAALDKAQRTFDEVNKDKIERLEKKIKNLQEFESKYYNDENKIKDLEFQISELTSKVELYRETITTQKEEIERITNKKR